MDTPENFTLHLPQETRHLFKKLCSVEDYRSDLRDIHEFLDQQLFTNPYPTLQVLKYHSTLNYVKTEELAYDALLKFLDEIRKQEASETSDRLFHKFFNFLANIDSPNHKTDVCDMLYERYRTCRGTERYQFLLSLLAQPSKEILVGVLERDSCQSPLQSKQVILHHAAYKHEHFIGHLLGKSESDPALLLSSQQGRIIGIIKLVQTLSVGEQICKKDFSFQSDFLDPLDSFIETCPVLDCLYYDLKRIANIFDMLRTYVKYDIPLNRLISAPFMDLVFKHTKFVSMGFDVASGFVRTNGYLLKRILDNNVSNTDHDILVAHHILATILDSYLLDRSDENYTQTIETNFTTIRDNIRSIDDQRIRIKLLENMYTMLFLRWENIITENLQVPRDSIKRGFICNKYLLEGLLKTIANAIDENLKRLRLHPEAIVALKNLKQSVDDAFWRLSCLVKDGLVQSPSTPRQQIVGSIIALLPNFHEELIEQRSSDDERNDSESHKKQKIKRKRSSTSRSVTMDTSRRLSCPLDFSVLSRRLEERGIVAKMLGSPLDLAIAALNRDDVTRAKAIIKRFNISDPKPQNDISFFENLRYLRSQLSKTIARYEEQDHDLVSSSTVERIKKVAAVGFETSRITNIIEDFIQTNELRVDPKSSELMEKYAKVFPFVGQYQQSRLQICTIVDLMIDLNMNHELSSNLWNMANRRYRTNELLEELSSQRDFYRSLGSINFFSHMVQCMQLFKTLGGENIGVKDMLLKTHFTLRPSVLKAELEREQTFKLLFEKSEEKIDCIANLKAIGKCLEELKAKNNYYTRFVQYAYNLLKLVHTARPSFPNSLSEMMRIDPKRIVGDLLFDAKLSPEDVEQLVIPLNMNLVHTIAIIVFPVIVSRELTSNSGEELRMFEYKDEVVTSYVSRHNPLLGYILQQIADCKRKLFGRSHFFQNATDLPENKTLATIYSNNVYMATLLFDSLEPSQFSECQRNQIILVYQAMQDVFHRIPELVALKDEAICEEIRCDISQVNLIEYINDLNLRARILIDNLNKITDADVATNLIKSILLDDCIDNIDPADKQHLKQYLNDIRIFAEVAKDFAFSTWCAAHIFGENSPDSIMKRLVKLKKFKLCYEWWEIHKNSMTINLNYFHEVFFESLIQTGEQIKLHLLKIIESFPREQVLSFFESNIDKFKNLPVMNYAVNYLIENTANTQEDPKSNHQMLKYRNYEVSLRIFDHLTWEECEQNWNLLSRPLLIIEQFVMNSKFELLSKVLNSIRPLLAGSEECKYCHEHRAIYEIPMNSSITLGSPTNSAFILLNLNLYKVDHVIRLECVDKLLQIYATKALHYKVKEMPASNEPISLSTDMPSLDSLIIEQFVMPKEPPIRNSWIKDEDARQCMCCKRAIFTMLTRRHHCRRCGRVVCSSCSTNRIKIPTLYQDIAVRACNDCFNQTQTIESTSRSTNQRNADSEASTEERKKTTKQSDWKLSGNVTHDKLLREEFSYEHSPSAHLCLTIMSFHSTNDDYVSLLLYHCRKFEKLLRPQRPGYPNPEIDYALVARMLNSLALAAKVRGGPTECDAISDHSAIIIAVVKEGCEALLPMETLNNISLRKLGDSLVSAEKWDLAKDIYVRCFHPTAGVMAVHGLASLRVGRYQTAREQLKYCMTPLCKTRDLTNILNFITIDEDLDVHGEIDIPVIRRPSRSPTLLDEVVKVIASYRHSHVPETLARADSIRNSNTSLASIKSKAKDKIPILDPAMNIINTISNLKKITRGNYCDISKIQNVDNKKQLLRNSLIFEESLFYLLSYGSHADIVSFLIRHEQTICALRYFLLQHLDNEIFIRNIYLHHLKRGKVDQLIKQMIAIDAQLSIWKDAIIQTCRYLETKNLLNSLYHLQNLLNDPIRASMTCVKFYSMHCSTFRDLQNNSFHLINAQKHLQSELEMCQWENINLSKQRAVKEPSFLMEMDAKTLNCHINTILRQMEVTKFLAKAEQDEKLRRSTRHVLKQIGVESFTVPTLFNSIQEKIQICILVLLCGSNIEEGFGLAYRIIQDYNLPAEKIYGTTVKYLARNDRLVDVEKLINCIKGNNGTSSTVYDKLLSLAIQAATNIHMTETKTQLDNLIKLIADVETKISCHIFVGQLKSAYLLAVQHNRLNDVKNILRHAEAGNQLHIKRLCEKKLNINSR